VSAPYAPRPLIGVTTSEVRLQPNSRPLKEGDPPQREMALGLPYLRAIERAGGLPWCCRRWSPARSPRSWTA
jgi:hypothetical protein